MIFNSSKIFARKKMDKTVQVNIEKDNNLRIENEILLLKKRIELLEKRRQNESLCSEGRQNELEFGTNDRNSRFIKNENFTLYY